MARYFRFLAQANFEMTTVPPEAVNNKDKAKITRNENVTIRGKFKSVNLYNETIHIILYPQDGLRTAANLQEIDEGTDIVLDLKEESF